MAQPRAADRATTGADRGGGWGLRLRAPVRFEHRHRPGHHRRASGRTGGRNPVAPVEPDGTGPSQPTNERPRPTTRPGEAREVVPRRRPASRQASSSHPGTTCEERHALPEERDRRDRRRGRPVEPVLPGAGDRGPRLLARRRNVPSIHRPARHRRRRCQRVRVLRRPAVRQRAAALRPPAHRLRQGRRAALPDHARSPGGASLRLGLPRPARRGRGREAARHRTQVRDRGDGGR